MDNKISGIYKIQSRIKPERIYIGSTVNYKSRCGRHVFELKKNKHHCNKLQNHANKYGVDDLVFGLIVECPVDRLRVKEQCYINVYQPFFNECKYVNNLSAVNDVKRSEKHKSKIALAQTGTNNSFYGKHHTIETRLKVREWNLLHPLTEETRKKQVESLLATIKEKKLKKLKNQLTLWQS